MSLGKLVVLAALAALPALGQSYCSLVVRVVNTPGIALPRIHVVVTEPNGHVEIADTSDSGEARFCGLGVPSTALKVGRSTCDQVLIPNLYLEWGKTRQVTVTYDACPIEESIPAVFNACRLVLRFQDQNERWISDVKFSPPLSRAPNVTSDEYGRMMIPWRTGEPLSGRVVREGFAPRQIDVACSREDHAVTLEPESR